MNVQDKGSLYASVAHVLKPGAQFVLFDIISAGTEEPQYPTPWAATSAKSFLATADEMSAHLERAGFSIIEIKDQTSQALTFLDQTFARIKSPSEGPPPLGLHLIMGPTFKESIENVQRNLAGGSLTLTLIHTRKQ